MCSRVDYDLKVDHDFGVNPDMQSQLRRVESTQRAWSRGGLMRVNEENTTILEQSATKLF